MCKVKHLQIHALMNNKCYNVWLLLHTESSFHVSTSGNGGIIKTQELIPSKVKQILVATTSVICFEQNIS